MATLTPLRLLFFSVFMCYLLQLSVSAKPTVGFTSNSSTESETSDTIEIIIERTGETNETTSVSIDITGTATRAPLPDTEGADYFAVYPTTVLFVNDNTTNINVYVFNDKFVENVETIVLTIRNDPSAFDMKAGFSSHTVYIIDDDVSINCASTPVSESAGTAEVTITRSGSPDALSVNHSIKCSTKDGTAVQPRDYTTHNTNLSFSSGNDIKKINIIIEDNDIPDGNKNLNVSCSTLTDDERVQIQNSCKDAVVTIQNDDTFIRCANQSIEVSEGNKTVYFTLKREGVLNKASPIWFSTKDGTAFDNTDYKPQNKVNKTFLPGQVYITLSVDLVDDEYNEDNETFSVIIGSYVPTTLTSGDNCTLFTIKDNDPNRITDQEAQELLVRRRKMLIILGVAGAFLALAVILFLCCICYLLRQQICSPGDVLLSK